ncbi:MAG: TOMM precursor leader peptide-binding protein [Candidatus Solibacter usitatus]|nr:TOMM precursor leader peptide-binding protein [Candidatus Solibacter usitatus]
MIERPVLTRYLGAHRLSANRALLYSEDEGVMVTGPLCGLVAGLIDGARSSDEIVGELAGQAPAPHLYYTLLQLERKGYISEAGPARPPHEAAFWRTLGAEPQAALAALAGASVGLRCFGGADPAPLQAALAELGITPHDDGAFLMVVAEDYLGPELEALNRQSLAGSRPWMLIRPAGRRVWIGPLFRPGSTGCWECLAQRLRINRRFPATAVLPGMPFLSRAVMGLAAGEAAKWIVFGKNETVDGAVWTLDTATLESRVHPLVRRPQCPACGGGSSPVNGSLERHISPITGVIPDLKRVGDTGAAAVLFETIQVVSRPAESFELSDSAMGRGRTEAQAKLSCAGEAIERYCASADGSEPRVRASYRELGAAAVYPPDLLLVSPRQYRNRKVWNRSHPGFNWVPEPFDESREIDWTPVQSFPGGQTRYLPTAYCYLRYPAPPDHRFCSSESSGCAAGPTLTAAIRHGFLESVERDALALWWYNRVRRPEVDLDSFEEPFFSAVRDDLRRWGRTLSVLDISSDLGIPVFAAVSATRAGRRILFGFGADPDAKTALTSALLEVNQMIAQERNLTGAAAEHVPELAAWLRKATLANQPYLKPARVPRKTAADYPQPGGPDTDLSWLVRAAARRGLETLMLDLTRPDIGVPVVRVTVPGLRPAWARYAPGRLYEVPVQLGWLKKARAESELNPIPFFL